MSVERKSAVDLFLARPKNRTRPEKGKISSYFAENVFTADKMRNFLSQKAYRSYIHALDNGEKIDRVLADQIASALKAWAMEKGTTHYTHWFQPLTGATAEKHDSFFSLDHQGNPVEEFDGGALVQQEPDASSFPSGGLRATFEARGYTAWDPSSPAFIMDIGGGKTLCIPTVFIAYTGEALDHKTPLLRSIEALDKAATSVAKLFDRHVTKVKPTLGWEQEYFLVDKAMYYARPDLVANGRTVFGRKPAKGQQLDDHYFGSIPERVYAFMLDFEEESHKLGIPVRTRHNEVAPSQFECAPMFEEANIAVDHNQLLMDLMDRVARRHDLIVLTHEKPFAGINGSGKHNNWSMGTDTGVNLLSPGKTPRNNLQFLVFFVNTIKAVHDHADLVRASIASESNDYRLGANEAPPAIISVFIGSFLSNVLKAVEARVNDASTELDENDLKLDIHKMIPDLMLDNTDRNRTSSFAFTGNKFEFRAPGSSSNCADPMAVINSIVAAQLNSFKAKVDEHIKGGEKKEHAIWVELRNAIRDSKNILFEGDNYSDNWVKEAESRGLKNIKDSARALDGYVSDSSKALFSSLGVMTEREVEARHEIRIENYTYKVDIESKVMEKMVMSQILPAAIRYKTVLLENLVKSQQVGLNPDLLAAEKDIVEKISNHINEVYKGIAELAANRDAACDITDSRAQAVAFCDNVKGLFDGIRFHVDELELYVGDTYWPLPKYREILFAR